MCIVFTNILDILLRFNEIVIVRWSRGHQVRHDKFSLTSLFSLYPCGFPPGTPVSSQTKTIRTQTSVPTSMI